MGQAPSAPGRRDFTGIRDDDASALPLTSCRRSWGPEGPGVPAALNLRAAYFQNSARQSARTTFLARMGEGPVAPLFEIRIRVDTANCLSFQTRATLRAIRNSGKHWRVGFGRRTERHLPIMAPISAPERNVPVFSIRLTASTIARLIGVGKLIFSPSLTNSPFR